MNSHLLRNRRRMWITLVVAGFLVISGCGLSGKEPTLGGKQPTLELTGVWAVEGSPGDKKIFRQNGICSNMIDVDIGGPMFCTLSGKGADGRYVLTVEQSPNSVTYLLDWNGADRVTVLDESGAVVWKLERAKLRGS